MSPGPASALSFSWHVIGPWSGTWSGLPGSGMLGAGAAVAPASSDGGATVTGGSGASTLAATGDSADVGVSAASGVVTSGGGAGLGRGRR